MQPGQQALCFLALIDVQTAIVLGLHASKIVETDHPQKRCPGSLFAPVGSLSRSPDGRR